MVNFKEFTVGLFSIKYGALALLVLQNTFLVVFMRYSRTSDGPLYATSTAVVMMEVCCIIDTLTIIDKHFIKCVDC